MFGIEGQEREFKARLQNPNDIAKAACAFGNTNGGKILVGVGDDGNLRGIERNRLDEAQRSIMNALLTVSPPPPHSIEVVDLDSQSYISVTIRPIDKGGLCTHNGVVYYRSGSSTIRLEGQSLRDFLVSRDIIRFDSRPTDATMGDVDEEKWVSYMAFRAPGRDTRSFDMVNVLRSVEAVVDEPPRLNNAGVLIFARSPKRYVPNNVMRLTRFNGNEAVDIIDSQEINDTLPSMLDTALAFVKRNTKQAMLVKGRHRENVPEYPETVMREIIVNALVHRDYFSDDSVHLNIFDARVEVINPGRLHKGISIADLGTMSVQRNRRIYQLMKDMDLVEGLATGIPRIRKDLKDLQYPEPEFREIGEFFKVVIRSKGSVSLTPREKAALRYLMTNETINSLTYSDINQVSRPTAVKDLKHLFEMGYLVRYGSGPSTAYSLKDPLDEGVIAVLNGEKRRRGG